MFNIVSLTAALENTTILDRAAALESARVYISQLESLEKRKIDEDEISPEDYFFILKAIQVSIPEEVAHCEQRLSAEELAEMADTLNLVAATLRGYHAVG